MAVLADSGDVGFSVGIRAKRRRIGHPITVHIVIVGAGEIGRYLAEVLVAEHHEVAVIEVDRSIAESLSAQLDVQVVLGSGSSPTALNEAGIKRADMLASVTQDDEVNMIAAILGKQAGVRTTVVRLQSDELRGPAGADLCRAVAADLIIDPDSETADEVLELVHSPGVDEVYPMPVGDLVVIGAYVAPESPFSGRTLSSLNSEFGRVVDFLVGAVTRDGETTIPGGDYQLADNDHIRVLTTGDSRRKLLSLLGIGGGEARKVMVLGGGAIGTRVASQLQTEGADVVVIERDPARAAFLSETLHKVVVVQGDITDTELLAQESISRMDAVVATSGEDASNVLACAFAAAEGSPFTVTVLHRLELLSLVRRLGIDAALSPRTASANSVLRQVRGGTAAVATFLESDTEVDEFRIEPGAPAEGMIVAEISLPDDVLLGARIDRDGRSEICSGNTRLHAGDHLVVFARPDSLAEARVLFTR